MKTIKDPSLFQKIREFLVEYLPIIRSKSVNTISAYKATINLYLLFLQTSQRIGLSDVEKKDFSQKNIIAFLEWLKDERGNGTATRNQRLVHIRKFCKYLMSSDMIEYAEYCDIYHLDKKLDDWIFSTRRNGITTQMSPDNTARFLNKYERQITKTNPDFPHLHPHLFRHTRAMHLYMAGMPLPLISEWLGHSQLETTTIYARATTDMKRKAAEKITTKENSVFKEETFKYANNDDIIKQLYGLA